MKTEGGCIPVWESKIRGQMNSDQLDITKKKKNPEEAKQHLFGSSNKWQIICTGKQKGTFRIFFARLQKNK